MAIVDATRQPRIRRAQSQGQLGVIEHAARQHGGVAAGGPPTKGRCRRLNRGCSTGFSLDPPMNWLGLGVLI